MQQPQYLYFHKTHVPQNTTQDKGITPDKVEKYHEQRKVQIARAWDYYQMLSLQTSRQDQGKDGDQSQEESSTKTQAQKRKHIN